MAPVDEDHEALLGRAALRVVGLLAVPTVAVAWLLRGSDGATTAAGGLALVGVGQYLTGLLLSWSARYGTGALMAATLGSFLARLGLYATLIITLSSATFVDAPTLAISVVLAVAAVLAHETRLVLREGSFWWLHASAGAPADETNVSAVPTVTAKDLA